MDERIKYLFRRYVDNTSSREKLEEFFTYVQEAKNDENLRNLIKKVYDTIRENSSSLTFVDETGHLILTKPDWLAQPVSSKKSLQKKIAVSVAIIACIIIVAGSTWLANRSRDIKKDVSQASPLTKKITERSEYKYLLLPD